MALSVIGSERPQWSNRAQFFIYIFALLFSPISFWEFPVLWYQTGGVALFIPLITALLAVGVPLVCLEISLAQFMQRGGPSAWGVVPLFKGISVTSMLLTLMKASANIILGAWSAYYLYLSAANQLPSCVIDSASARPFDHGLDSANTSRPPAVQYTSQDPTKSSHSNRTRLQSFNERPPLSPEFSTDLNMTCQEMYSHFWSTNVLDKSQSISTPGLTVIEIFISTVIVSLGCYALVVRDITWSGKIMYIMAPLPLVGFLSIIVWTASSGWNIGRGIYTLLSPDFQVLTHPEPWFACVKVTLLTLGVGLNVLPSLGSYNKLVIYTVRDSWLVCVMAVTANVLASVTLLGLLGQFTSNIDMDNEPSLMLVLVTAVLTRFQHQAVLCALFLIFIITIIMSTTAVYIESLVTSLVDLSLELRRWRLPIVTATVSVCFLLTLPMSTQGGVYVYRVFRRVTDGGFLIIVISVLECLVVGAVYGGSRFYDNLEMMTGKRPHWWMNFCWTWLSPLILLATLVYQEYSAPLYILDLRADHHDFDFARVLLMLMVALLLLPIIVVAAWVVYCKNGRFIKKIQSALRPDLKPHQVPIRWRLEGHWIKFTDRL